MSFRHLTQFDDLSMEDWDALYRQASDIMAHPEAYIDAAQNQGCQVICCSALFTTTMGVMEEVVKAAETAGIRDKVKIMVGGAPVTQDFCEKIGADKYTPDAATAADAAVELCKAI